MGNTALQVRILKALDIRHNHITNVNLSMIAGKPVTVNVRYIPTERDIELLEEVLKEYELIERTNLNK